jgi:hypothetical protein
VSHNKATKEETTKKEEEMDEARGSWFGAIGLSSGFLVVRHRVNVLGLMSDDFSDPG